MWSRGERSHGDVRKGRGRVAHLEGKLAVQQLWLVFSAHVTDFCPSGSLRAVAAGHQPDSCSANSPVRRSQLPRLCLIWWWIRACEWNWALKEEGAGRPALPPMAGGWDLGLCCSPYSSLCRPMTMVTVCPTCSWAMT